VVTVPTVKRGLEWRGAPAEGDSMANTDGGGGDWDLVKSQLPDPQAHPYKNLFRITFGYILGLPLDTIDVFGASLLRGRAPEANGVPVQIFGAEQTELRTILADSPSGVEERVSEQALCLQFHIHTRRT
jgi:hypothetical protein